MGKCISTINSHLAIKAKFNIQPSISKTDTISYVSIPVVKYCLEGLWENSFKLLSYVIIALWQPGRNQVQCHLKLKLLLILSRYFRGKELVLCAIRPINSGGMVTENYGPVFTLKSKEERIHNLAGRYWFTCECTACIEHWPKQKEIDESIINIRWVTR